MVYETTSSRVGVPEKSCRERERERRNPAAWTCNKSAVTTTPAAYPRRPIRYGTTSIPSIHHPTDRPTNQQRPRDVQKRIRQIRHHHHPHSHHTKNQCKIHQLHQYLPDLTSPHLTSPFLDPTQKRKLPHLSIHLSERTGPSRYPSQVKSYSPKALVTTLH